MRWDCCPAYAGARRTWTVSRETPGRMHCGHAPRRFVLPMHVVRNDLLPGVSCTIVSVEDWAWGLLGAGAGISLKNSKGHLFLQE